MLFEETRDEYLNVNGRVEFPIALIEFNDKKKIVEYIQALDQYKDMAILRFRHNDCVVWANVFSENGMKFTYIPRIPINDITTESA